ncbi:MAG: hypothetical protein U1E17_05280 [Geminicoccaceae bacterium]
MLRPILLALGLLLLVLMITALDARAAMRLAGAGSVSTDRG